MKAGLFDRAETAWRALEGTTFEAEARLALLTLFERSRDWVQALHVSEHLAREMPGAFDMRQAHYLCELALEADRQGDQPGAEQWLHRAHQAAPQSPRPWLQRGLRLAAAGAHPQALQAWDHLVEQHPATFALIAGDYADSAQACGRSAEAELTLTQVYQRLPGLDLLRALGRLPGRDATPELLTHLREHPQLGAAADLLARPPAEWPEGSMAALHTAVEKASRPLQRYRCAACGFEATQHFWQCPGCLSWDSTPPLRIEEQ
jgi:lipopolysaccharide biosynthesis regulator YciM